jgi:hypothetical protein
MDAKIVDKTTWFQPFIVLLIFTQLMSCTPWKLLKEPVKEQLIQKEPTEVKIKLKSGKSYVLEEPIFHGDSLTGIKWKNDTLAFALNDIQETSVRELHPEGTVLLVLILVGVPVFLVLMTVTQGSYL